MTFDDFISAIKSAISVADGIGILLSMLAFGGIGIALGAVPTIAAIALGALAYVFGYLASCYRYAKRKASGELADEIDTAMTAERDSALSRLADAEAEIVKLNRRITSLSRENAILSSDENKAKYAAMSEEYEEKRRKKQARSRMNKLSPKEASLVLKVFEAGTIIFPTSSELQIAKNLIRDKVLELDGLYDLRLSRTWKGYLNDHMDVFIELYGDAS